ncbi:hypothetical protein WN55_04823 [Dufourea novaeangliae]|uniref:Uncharacterized protein n=1 Tax=Dufourea novaeangliae TaxID=178035 RepID=A0A154NZH5_DUFNO|nr:hypothetical protein WN55_04823 [Dufourea novaeangliae]
MFHKCDTANRTAAGRKFNGCCFCSNEITRLCARTEETRVFDIRGRASTINIRRCGGR